MADRNRDSRRPLENTVSSWVPMSAEVAEGVVTTCAGDYMTTWRLTGLDFVGCSKAILEARKEAMNLLVRGLSNGHYAFWAHRVRRRVRDTLSIPEGGFAGEMLKKYNEDFYRRGLFNTELYLTLVYRPTPLKRSRFFSAADGTVSPQAECEQAVEHLAEIDKRIRTVLASFGPKRLGRYTRDGLQFSEHLEFYAYLLNGHWWRVPVKNVPLYRYLPVSRLFFGNEFIEKRDVYGSLYAALIDVKDYADHSFPGILNPLLGVSSEFIETHSFSPVPSLQALADLTRHKNQMRSSGDKAVSLQNELDYAIDGVASGDFAIGEYHYSLQTWSDSIDNLKSARAQVIEALQSSGFLAGSIDLVTDDAYFAQLPGNWRCRHRLAKITSRNFSSMFSMHAYPQGKRSGNPWGEAVALLQTPCGEPYYFNFHSTAKGENSFGLPALANTQVIGQSGGGKTTLILFLLVNLLKYKTQCVYFDKDRGAEIAIRAIGGNYLPLERGVPTGLNPFKLPPDRETRLFWEDLIKQCVALPHVALSAQEEADISHAVNALAELPERLRCFEAVVQNLPYSGAESLGSRLSKWCSADKLGWLLNCEEDTLNLDTARVYGFDYSEVIDDPVAAPALMMYLLYRIELLLDGRRFAFFIDEYWKALSTPYFEEFAKNKQKTIRKQNGFGVFMTQSPSDTLSNPICKTLIEQSATMIFLPNPSADEHDYIDGFKLTPEEFAIVKGLQDSSRQFLVKQGASCAIAMLDLASHPDVLRVLSGTSANVARLEQLRAQYGDSPECWLPHFLA